MATMLAHPEPLPPPPPLRGVFGDGPGAAGAGGGDGAAESDAGCSPGVYQVAQDNAAVRAGIGRDTPIIARLQQGESVLVVEVAHCPEDRRVRGRLARPPGWISLLETELGWRWAVRSFPVNRDKALLIKGILDFDDRLDRLRDRAARLRAEHEAQLMNFGERASELEQRLLSSRIEATSRAPPPPRAGDPAGGAHHAHLEHDRAHHVAWGRDTTLPPGATVIDEQRLALTPAQAWAFAVYPPEHRHPDEEAQQKVSGDFVISNAVLLPSPNYADVLGKPEGVFPVTRPPRAAIGLDFLDGSRAGLGAGGAGESLAAPGAPAPTPEQYGVDTLGAWRLTAAGGCPLAAAHMEMVEDVYAGRGDKGEHMHPQVVWRSTLPPQQPRR